MSLSARPRLNSRSAWAEPPPGSGLIAANCSVLRVNSPGPSQQDSVPSPQAGHGKREASAASRRPSVGTVAGHTSVIKSQLHHPHGHCSPRSSTSGSKDLLGLTALRFGSGGMFVGTSCWVTLLWHLPACILHLGRLFISLLLTGDTISAHLQISGDQLRTEKRFIQGPAARKWERRSQTQTLSPEGQC